MGRGARLLNSIFEESQLEQMKVETAKETTERGRSLELLRRRNERLVDRLYYYRFLKKLRDEDYYALLEQQFDLSISTIGQIIVLDEWTTHMRVLMRDKTTERDLRKKWDWMVW